ncbi:hypothetical protein HYU18_00825 [Candidatus Woesearchaeota archaeon]|nr:hypothetical protein [Candidatus Woesearchaeota archaeon]
MVVAVSQIGEFLAKAEAEILAAAKSLAAAGGSDPALLGQAKSATHNAVDLCVEAKGSIGLLQEERSGDSRKLQEMLQDANFRIGAAYHLRGSVFRVLGVPEYDITSGMFVPGGTGRRNLVNSREDFNLADYYFGLCAESPVPSRLGSLSFWQERLFPQWAYVLTLLASDAHNRGLGLIREAERDAPVDIAAVLQGVRLWGEALRDYGSVVKVSERASSLKLPLGQEMPGLANARIVELRAGAAGLARYFTDTALVDDFLSGRRYNITRQIIQTYGCIGLPVAEG